MSKASRQQIDFAIAALFRPGDIVELWIPKAGRFREISGYFDDFGRPRSCGLAIHGWCLLLGRCKRGWHL